MCLQTSHTQCWNSSAKGASAVSTRGESVFFSLYFSPPFFHKRGRARMFEWEADEGREESITRPNKS